MMIPDFILRMFGRRIADKLDLQEGKMPDSKPWYQSKAIWSGVVAGLIGIYNSVAIAKGLPAVPDFVYTILGAIGVYSRATASTTITS
jgi:hypothetical protein